MKKTNILLICPDTNDSTSLYRGAGPYYALERDNEGINILVSDAKNMNAGVWPNFQYPHIMVYQRPFRNDDATLIDAAKSFGVKVIIDFDDDLFCVQRDNPVVALYENPNTKKALVDCCNLADVVTVSTEHLKNSFIKNTGADPDKFVVIRNGFDQRWVQHFWNHGDRKKIVTWRGSNTHRRDCMEVKDAFLQYMKEQPEYKAVMYGWTNDVFTYELPFDRYYTSTLPVIAYQKHIHSIHGHLGIVPLLDNEFNRAKSNIGFIELVSSGHMCIAKNLPEFSNAGAMVYETQDEFYNLLTRFTNDFEASMTVWRNQFRYLLENLTLKQPNELRLEVIKALHN